MSPARCAARPQAVAGESFTFEHGGVDRLLARLLHDLALLEARHGGDLPLAGDMLPPATTGCWPKTSVVWRPTPPTPIFNFGPTQAPRGRARDVELPRCLVVAWRQPEGLAFRLQMHKVLAGGLISLARAGSPPADVVNRPGFELLRAIYLATI